MSEKILTLEEIKQIELDILKLFAWIVWGTWNQSILLILEPY